ncbi:uncharacterized protein LOC111917479 [Lactuca sativa]|uniref:uncharacterized protein LOC111917479 n=1 Tax=Lactuca sativa TaxID=4236 RepID=UPI0022AE5388|nr:uncharacterized protein LOC111917479 [Lactuca sativa]
MVWRILGGIATSLLFSAFESWLVAEHNKRGFEQQWLSITFSKAIFLGNGLVAILAGLFGNLLVGSLAMGPVAPFDAASIFLAIGMAIIISSWTKNYGDSSESKDLMTQFRGAAVAIASDEKIALLGAIQSLFEGSMYTFVFLWTPALSPNGEDIPHGFIFATFMLSSMLGSYLASRLLAHTLTYIDIVLCCVHTLLKGLEKIIASADIPMFVCRDFNSVPRSKSMDLLCVSKRAKECYGNMENALKEKRNIDVAIRYYLIAIEALRAAVFADGVVADEARAA